jgi:nitroimidazol reductase NimA-like FMN-containing flavoprotein (pyridoxamine 5'-phosphate oxidase superfamily)
MVVQEMTRTDCLNALARSSLGRLGCARDNQPYVVPIYFVYEELYLYGFTTLGQKVEWMRSNPLVCVELDEVEDPEQWMSILVFGRYEELEEPPAKREWDQEQRRALAHEAWQPTAHPGLVSSSPDQQARLHAHRLLQEHRTLWCQPGCASRRPDQPLIPIFYRIRVDRITGRRAQPDPAKAERSPHYLRDEEGRGRLGGFLHSLIARLLGSRKAQRYGGPSALWVMANDREEYG